LIFLHLLVAPFTKIEESFNIEATRDLLTYGFPQNANDIARNFEHALYPGPVPRTFVGPVALATAAAPFAQNLSGFQRQFLGRLLFHSIAPCLI
jgi:alpha-1,6-mannosyltransferase